MRRRVWDLAVLWAAFGFIAWGWKRREVHEASFYGGLKKIPCKSFSKDES